MKAINKGLVAAAILATTSFANAGTVTLPNGISFQELTIGDTDEGSGNFNSSFDFVQWWEDSSSKTETSLTTMFDGSHDDNNYNLNGYGELTGLNSGTGKFNCNGCEMTLSFGGIGLVLIDEVNPLYTSSYATYTNFVNQGGTEAEFVASTYYVGIGSPSATIEKPTLNLDNGFMDIYVDYTPDLDVIASLTSSDTVLANEINAINGGDAWLKLAFSEVELTPKAIDEQTGLATDGVAGLSRADTSFGLTATGGAAFDGFDQADDLKYLTEQIETFVDIIAFGLSGSFTYNTNTNAFNLISANSTGTVAGIAVPEPTSIAIFGLGLLGLAGAARRKQAK